MYIYVCMVHMAWFDMGCVDRTVAQLILGTRGEIECRDQKMKPYRSSLYTSS